MLEKLGGAEARIGASDAPMRLIVGIPAPCETCDTVIREILPRLLATDVDRGLLAIDLRVVHSPDRPLSRTLTACTAAALQAVDSWRRVIETAPVVAGLASSTPR